MEEHKVCVTDKEYDEGKEGNCACVLGRWVGKDVQPTPCSYLSHSLFSLPLPPLFSLVSRLFH